MFSVPAGVLNLKEQRDIVLTIAGQKPIGKPICNTNYPKGGYHKINFMAQKLLQVNSKYLETYLK